MTVATLYSYIKLYTKFVCNKRLYWLILTEKTKILTSIFVWAWGTITTAIWSRTRFAAWTFLSAFKLAWICTGFYSKLRLICLLHLVNIKNVLFRLSSIIYIPYLFIFLLNSYISQFGINSLYFIFGIFILFSFLIFTFLAFNLHISHSI